MEKFIEIQIVRFWTRHFQILYNQNLQAFSSKKITLGLSPSEIVDGEVQNKVLTTCTPGC